MTAKYSFNREVHGDNEVDQYTEGFNEGYKAGFAAGLEAAKYAIIMMIERENNTKNGGMLS